LRLDVLIGEDVLEALSLHEPPLLSRLARGAVETFRLPTVPPTIDDYLALAVRGSSPGCGYGRPNPR